MDGTLANTLTVFVGYPGIEGQFDEYLARARDIVVALERAGHRVLLYIWEGLAGGADYFPSAHSTWNVGSQESIVGVIPADGIAFFCGWESCFLRAKPAALLVVDLPHSAFQIARLERQPSTERKLLVLSLADLLLVRNSQLRLYFSGWLVQSGRVPQNRDFLQVLGCEELKSEEGSKKLAELIRRTTRLAPSVPVVGSACGRPSFLRAPGQVEFVPCAGRITQQVIVPAENLSAIEIPIQLGRCEDYSGTVELSVRASGGRRIAARSFAPSELSGMGKIVIKLPVLTGPKGGEVLAVELRSKLLAATDSASSQFRVGFVGVSGFPFGGYCQGSQCGRDLALAVGFRPGESTIVYRLKILSERAVHMVRQGQYKRFFRALRRRVPELFGGMTRKLMARS